MDDFDLTPELAAVLRAAGAAPHGPTKVALLEEAVALADARDDGLRFAVRQELLWPAYHGGRPDLVLVHFAWCLAFLDRHPDRPPLQTLWQYRWVVDTMPDFPAVARAQIEAASADMRDRYRAGGWSVRPVWLNRRRVLAKMGDTAGAADAHRHYAAAPRDAMSDAPAQDRAFAIDYADFRRDDADATRLAREHLAAADSPQGVVQAVADSLMAFVRRGEWSEAAGNVKRCTRLLARNPALLGANHHVLTYLTITGDLAAAARFFAKEFAAAAAEPGEFARVPAYKAGLFFARRLTDAGPTRVTLEVPAGFVPGDPGASVTPAALRDHLEAALPALCARADARNGNAYHTDRLADLAESAALARSAP